MFPRTSQTIPWSDLPPANPGSLLAAEWETYRSEVGHLLEQGLEGKFVLIKGKQIVGVFDTWDAARQAGLEKYLLQPHMIHPILSQEPVLRGPSIFRSCKT